MKIGFTGTKHGMKPEQYQMVHLLLQILQSPNSEFHHGDCVGADFQAAHIAKKFNYVVVCHPPIKNKYRARFKFNNIILIEQDYLDRDRDIVTSTDILIAAPHTPYEIKRSGTWTTIRYARELKHDIILVLPNGIVEEERFPSRRAP